MQGTLTWQWIVTTTVLLSTATSRAAEDPRIDQLVQDANAADRMTRIAAYGALGASGDPAAIVPLRAGTLAESWLERSRATDALLALATTLHAAGRAPEAIAVYDGLLRTHTSPSDTYVRCAAVRGLAKIGNEGAVRHLLPALGSDNEQVRSAAIDSAVNAAHGGITTMCVRGFSTAPPRGRAARLLVLARRSEQAGLTLAIDALADDARDVRHAAIEAVAALGGARAVGPLVAQLGTEDADERRAVQVALGHLSGPNVTATLTRMVPNLSSAAACVALLEVLSERPPADNLEPIFTAAHDPDATVRAAALRTLGVLATHADLADLLELLAEEREPRVRAAAIDAVAAVAEGCDQPDQCVTQMLAFGASRDVALQAALLVAAGQIGTPAARAAVQDALGTDEPELVDAAVQALSRWPDASATDIALAVMKYADNDALRHAALTALDRMIKLAGDRPASERAALCERGLAAARTDDERRVLIERLRAVADPASTDLLVTFLDDEALRDAAANALLAVGRVFVPRRPADARQALTPIMEADVSARTKAAAQEALNQLAWYESYISDWWIAGPYAQDGRPGHDLFEVTFPPEQEHAAAPIDWRRYEPGADLTDWWQVDLAREIGGDNQAAYLLTRIHASEAQPARLELGSDDGITAWLNGEVVHRNNALRGVMPSDDIVDVELRRGVNTLLLKITNDGGGWGASARVRGRDGAALPDVHADAGERP